MPGIGLRIENGANVGRVGDDVRCHHNDIAGPKIRVFFEQSQQAIVEHFDFA